MADIELEPDLSNCVQTLARREYDRLTRELLMGDEEDPELQRKHEALRIFLESTDFAALRSRYEPHLVQGRRVRFTLRQTEDKAEYDIEIE